MEAQHWPAHESPFQSFKRCETAGVDYAVSASSMCVPDCSPSDHSPTMQHDERRTRRMERTGYYGMLLSKHQAMHGASHLEKRHSSIVYAGGTFPLIKQHHQLQQHQQQQQHLPRLLLQQQRQERRRSRLQQQYYLLRKQQGRRERQVQPYLVHATLPQPHQPSDLHSFDTSELPPSPSPWPWRLDMSQQTFSSVDDEELARLQKLSNEYEPEAQVGLSNVITFVGGFTLHAGASPLIILPPIGTIHRASSAQYSYRQRICSCRSRLPNQNSSKRCTSHDFYEIRPLTSLLLRISLENTAIIVPSEAMGDVVGEVSRRTNRVLF